MFVNFDENFNDDSKSQFNIPSKYIEYINKDLPKGLKYVKDKYGNYVVATEKDEIEISGIKIILSKEQRKILGDKFKLEDILDYAYNSQQKIEIQPINPGYIQINNEKISIDKLIENPLNPITIMEEKAYIFPPKIEQELKIKLSDGNYERTISVKRVPNNSIKVLSFESKEDETLKVNYNYNKSKNILTMNISVNLQYAKKIKDIVESIYIYNAFINGRGYINGHLIDLKIKNNQYKRYDEDSANFWRKLLKIEEKLGIEFVPPKKHIEYDNILDIEEIYQSLVLKKPFKSRTIIDTIDYKIDLMKKDELDNYKDRTLLFQFNAKYTNLIFGCEINLQALVMSFNSKILKIEENKINGKITIGDENKDKKRYSSVMYFKDDRQLEEFKKKLNNNTIKLFRDAKSVQ